MSTPDDWLAALDGQDAIDALWWIRGFAPEVFAAAAGRDPIRSSRPPAARLEPLPWDMADPPERRLGPRLEGVRSVPEQGYGVASS